MWIFIIRFLWNEKSGKDEGPTNEGRESSLKKKIYIYQSNLSQHISLMKLGNGQITKQCKFLFKHASFSIPQWNLPEPQDDGQRVSAGSTGSQLTVRGLGNDVQWYFFQFKIPTPKKSDLRNLIIDASYLNLWRPYTSMFYAFFPFFRSFHFSRRIYLSPFFYTTLLQTLKV